jgi:hypothetical protein
MIYQVSEEQYDYLLDLHQRFYEDLKDKSEYNFASGEHDTGMELVAALMVLASQQRG